MPTNYPTSIDTFSTKVDGVSDVLAADTNNLQDAVVALQNRVGTAAGPTFLPRAGGTMTGQITGLTSGGSTNGAFYAATSGGAFTGMWNRYAPFRSTVVHAGSSYAPTLSVYYEYTGSYNGHYSIGHLATGDSNPGNMVIHHINSSGTASQTWHFDGANGDFVSTGDVRAYSDERLKTNWRDLDHDFLSKLADVKVGIYDRKDTGETQVGVGAQSMQRVLPASVRDVNGFLTVAYGNAALAACVALAREVVALAAEVKDLKLRVSAAQ